MALGLCRQSELDAAVQKANAKKLRDGGAISDDERRKLVSTSQSLTMPVAPKMPEGLSGLETFGIVDMGDDPRDDDEDDKLDVSDADSFFNLPGDADDDEDDGKGRRR